MIKVINIKNENFCWECIDIDNNYCYYECPALNKFLGEGWSIKDWKPESNGAIFILEKN